MAKTVELTAAKDRYRTHTSKVLSNAARDLARQSVIWATDLDGPFVTLGGQLVIRFWYSDYGHVYGQETIGDYSRGSVRMPIPTA